MQFNFILAKICLFLLFILMKNSESQTKVIWLNWSEWSETCERNCSQRFGIQQRRRICALCEQTECIRTDIFSCKELYHNFETEEKFCFNGN